VKYKRVRADTRIGFVCLFVVCRDRVVLAMVAKQLLL